MADERPQEPLRELLEEVVDGLGLDADIDMVVDDEGGADRVVCTARTSGLFIGRHGQTIEAVQHLAQRIAARRPGPAAAAGSSSTPPATARGARRPERQADEAADDAVRDGRPVALDAMTRHRAQASCTSTCASAATSRRYSEGDEPDRHLVVAPLRG